MKRTLMQVYVKGSAEAVALYRRAFQAEIVCDGGPEHTELDVYGQILAVSEARDRRRRRRGNNMQFCLHFSLEEKDRVTKAYEVLKEGAKKALPPDSCDWSPYVTGIVDKFGINWCLFITA